MIHTFVVKILPAPDELPLRHAAPVLHGLLLDITNGDQYSFTNSEILVMLLHRLTKPLGQDDTLNELQTQNKNDNRINDK